MVTSYSHSTARLPFFIAGPFGIDDLLFPLYNKTAFSLVSKISASSLKSIIWTVSYLRHQIVHNFAVVGVVITSIVTRKSFAAITKKRIVTPDFKRFKNVEVWIPKPYPFLIKPDSEKIVQSFLNGEEWSCYVSEE